MLINLHPLNIFTHLIILHGLWSLQRYVSDCQAGQMYIFIISILGPCLITVLVNFIFVGSIYLSIKLSFSISNHIWVY